MTRLTPISSWAIALLAGLVLGAAQAAATPVNYSTTTSGNVYTYDTVTGLTTLRMDETVVFDDGSANLDALWVDSATGNLVFSTATTEQIGGVAYQDEDLILYDASTGTASLYLDLTSVLGAAEDVDAVEVLSNGHVLLSTTTNASIGALSFQDEDVVEYDPSTGTASLYFDGTSVLGGTADIDGIQITPSGRLVFSTTSNVTIGGTTYDRNDILVYDPVGGAVSLYLDVGALLGGSTNVNGFYVPEPGTVLLLSTGALGFLLLGRTRP